VPALELFRGLRVVAVPEALDGARWIGDDVNVIRTAPDEALALGATVVEVDDPDAIVEDEAGLVVARLDAGGLRAVEAHTDWALPLRTGELGQGKVAGVPAKVVGGTPAFLVANAAHADELRERLGW
jgi:hypothetical protein